MGEKALFCTNAAEVQHAVDTTSMRSLHHRASAQSLAWEPAWKCSSLRQLSMPAPARTSTTATISDALSPNLALSPHVVPQCLLDRHW